LDKGKQNAEAGRKKDTLIQTHLGNAEDVACIQGFDVEAIVEATADGHVTKAVDVRAHTDRRVGLVLQQCNNSVTTV
jgi:hypothetical protein